MSSLIKEKNRLISKGIYVLLFDIFNGCLGPVKIAPQKLFLRKLPPMKVAPYENTHLWKFLPLKFSPSENRPL